MTDRLLILGASARAAACSALRAGLLPWCADLFADLDLQARCPALTVPAEDYPDGLGRLADDGPPGPWLYTGALENAPRTVARIRRWRVLWGNDERVLRAVRDPVAVAAALREARVSCPAVCLRGDEVPAHGRWLAKPIRGAGGRAIRFAGPTRQPARCGEVYYQEFIAGEPCSAIYAGAGGRATFLGATRQLVGEPWLHASAFGYCGSVGPLSLDPHALDAFRRLGDALAAAFGLRGLFGVDCVLRDGTPWPVEVNPRYTASVEVLEHATGLRALAWHRRAFDPTAPTPPALVPDPAGVIGKAVYYAPRDLIVPDVTPWTALLEDPPTADVLTPFADLPPAGQHIAAGRPVVTALVRGASIEDAVGRLREVAADLDRRLTGR